mmetsp:Transcript_13701/g.51086  ORF Transcript_13701/g.51086 Transcript_13701/m.51086 type:complete len:125 (-) Transcript_13701:1105-1479(-)|eukprot:scaffold870_cov268-Pinguiococcus_pyrenoidosus.AAC.34
MSTSKRSKASASASNGDGLKHESPTKKSKASPAAEAAAVNDSLPTYLQRGADDYEPQNILITGGAGFIASHVVSLSMRRMNPCGDTDVPAGGGGNATEPLSDCRICDDASMLTFCFAKSGALRR